MQKSLSQAPIGEPLVITGIANEAFAARLASLGLYTGARLTRLDDSAGIGPVKVRGAAGDAVLTGWLAGKVVIHLDDDRRLPLLECSPGESGHVEGITGQTQVEESLKELGISEGDRIRFLRRVPPMNYKFTVNDKQHEHISEALAACLLGETTEGVTQFSSAGAGEPFVVKRILPVEGAEKALAAVGVVIGSQLVLMSVSVSQGVGFSAEKPVACVTKDGLRLYFDEQDADGIYVSK